MSKVKLYSPFEVTYDVTDGFALISLIFLFMGNITKPKAKTKTMRHVPACVLVGCVDATMAWSCFNWASSELKQKTKLSIDISQLNFKGILNYYIHSAVVLGMWFLPTLLWIFKKNNSKK